MTPVSVGFTVPVYNCETPFHPDTHYPELGFGDVSSRPNWPYALLRETLRSLGLDREHFGTDEWNPFGGFVKPGQTILLKPNFVLSANDSGHDVFAMITHPSLLRAVADYAYLALRGEGRIVIADVPQMDCDWDELMRVQRLDAIQEFYQQRFRFPIEVYDLRTFALIDRKQMAFSENRKSLPGDPAGETIINLGRRSHFYGLPHDNYYGADYDRQETIAHHHDDVHEYCVSRTMLQADVFFSIPKMKTHKKVGVTLNLKGLVGMNTNKNYLIHYRLGSPSQGGDQLPDARSGTDRLLVRTQRWAWDALLARRSRQADAVYQVARRIYRAGIKPLLRMSEETALFDAGNWHGNDSAWRMTADLAKILFYADVDGRLHDTPQRKLFCVVDGIVGGERRGPLEPDARRAGCLVAGPNPFAVDLVTTRLMGFDPRKVRQFDVAFDPAWRFGLSSPADIEVHMGEQTMPGRTFFDPESRDPYLGFAPHPGWIGHLEV